MQDLHLWRLLDADELDPDALVPTVADLASLPPSRRAPWLGKLDRALSHPEARLRAAAVRALEGATGWRGICRVVDALHDGDPEVRTAAADTLASLLTDQPARIAHLVFHPDPEVRRRALEADAIAGTSSIRIHLLADPIHSAALVERGFAPSEGNLDLILALRRASKLDAGRARRWVADVGAPQQLVWARRAPHRTAAQVKAILDARDLSAPGADRLDALFALFAEGPAKDPDRARFFDGWRKHLAHLDLGLAREVAAAIVVAGERIAHTPEAVAAVACQTPVILGWTDVPRAQRRAAVDVILREPPRRTAPDPLLAALAGSDLVRHPKGGLDLPVAAALMLFRRGERYGWAADTFGIDTLASGFSRDPLAGAAFLGPEDRSSRGRAWMIAKLRERAPTLDSTILAIGAILGDPASSLKPARDWLPEGRARLVQQLLALEGEPGLALKDAQAKALAHELVPRFAKDGAALEAWLARSDHRASRLGRELLRRLGQVHAAEAMARLIVGLPTKLMRRLLAIADEEALLSLAQERVLARRLEEHGSPAISAWARERLPPPGAEIQPRGGFAEGDEIAPLPGHLEEAIREAADLEDGTIQRCFGGRYHGLVEALRARAAPPSPSVAVATALLGSHDLVENVADELERWIDADDPSFMRALEESLVTVLGGRSKIPLHAKCWLYRFERHGLAAARRLAAASGGLAESLAFAASLGCVEMRVRIFATVARAYGVWWRREPETLARLSHLDHLLDVCLDEVDRDAGVYAAILYRTVAESRLVASAVAAREAALQARIADCADEVRWELRDLADARGLPSRARGARAGHGAISRSLLAMIRDSDDLDALVELCRDRRLRVVHEAVLRLATLSEEGRARLAALIAEEPPPIHFAAICASLSLWEEGEALDAMRRWLAAGSGSGELRFGVALGLLEAGDADAEAVAIAEACAPAEGSWISGGDAERLLARLTDPDVACRRLALSPHPPVYRLALEGIVSRTDSRPEDLEAVRAFLELGTERQLGLRIRAAFWLEHRGDATGQPLLMALALEGHEAVPREGRFREAPEDLVRAAVRGVLLAGSGGRGIEPALVGMLAEVPRTLREPLLERLLTEATHVATRSAVIRALPRRPTRARKLRRLAEIFAWGLTISRELSGRVLRPHMISGEELGFTRLNENRVFITPLPLLRGERSGDEIVEGLILHEIGHHRHHRGPDEAAIWEQADRAGLGALLNLVADEHLERNLRAYDRAYGDKLKRLAAYAFQHAPRQIRLDRLLPALGAEAFEVLSACRLGAGVRPDAVRVGTGAVLQELERRGSSFARFMRALRMGLGDRHGDPKVAAGLALFEKRFRKSSMGKLWSITRELHAIFGDAVVCAQAFGGPESIEGDPHDTATHGEGIGDDELQGEVERVLGPPDGSQGTSRSKRRGRPVINVGGDETFHTLDEVIRVPADPAKHRRVAREIDRHARRLRAHLERLGLSHVRRRMRLSGRRLDVTRIRPLVTRGDPRILVAREIRITNDLFLGLVIDCSGSMSGASMRRAHSFGVLLTEAARGLSNVDLRIFGFDDRRIFDAGDARRPAVTSLEAGAGNNDAGGLWHAAQIAMRSHRKAKVLVMISDGLPTECSVAALRGLVRRLTQRHGLVCAQVAVRPLEEICFPHYVEVDESNLDHAVGRFGRIVANLVGRTLKG